MDNKEKTDMDELNEMQLAEVTGGAGVGEGTIAILIRDLHGREYHYTVNPETITVYDLKLMWTGEELHVPLVRLIYRAKEMEDSRTLASYGISNGDTIHLIFGRH